MGETTTSRRSSSALSSISIPSVASREMRRARITRWMGSGTESPWQLANRMEKGSNNALVGTLADVVDALVRVGLPLLMAPNIGCLSHKRPLCSAVA